MARTNTTRCPHCGSRCYTLKTKQITPTYREITYKCSNSDCTCIFVADLEAVRELSPSDAPNPDINLPRSWGVA